MNAADDSAGAKEADTGQLRAIALGDGAALKALFDRTSSHVALMALRILGTPAEAEDVVQETFAQVWRIARDYDPARGSALSWVLTIAKSRSVDRIRSRERRRSAESENLPAATWPPPREDHERLQRVMRELPQSQSNLLRLAYFDGMSQSEIASSLALPLGTVKTRMRSGLARLTELLKDPAQSRAEDGG